MIDLNCNCDECRKRLGDGDEIICKECYDSALKEIDRLEQEIAGLKEPSDAKEK